MPLTFLLLNLSLDAKIVGCLAGKCSARKDYINFIITNVMKIVLVVTIFVMILVTMNVLVIIMKIIMTMVTYV